VHPNCTTYEEAAARFIAYAEAMRAVAPESEYLGPNSCCWWYYWHSMLGDADKAAHDGMDFLPWYLRTMADYEAETGERLLDVLTIHYYPAGLFSDEAGEEIAARRLRSTRSLWDPEYVDESWIGEPVDLIPRMVDLIDTYYPGTKLGITEWNWGADGTMNGALTIADVLGIYGRENVYLAAYWMHPESGTPGYYAFKMFTNFDDQGTMFGGAEPISVPAVSSNEEQVASFAALDDAADTLYLLLINKEKDVFVDYQLQIDNFTPAPTAMQYRYDETFINQIRAAEVAVADNSVISLPPYSLTLLVIPAAE
jgi:hypothetical protein